jgi:hypothetical protein
LTAGPVKVPDSHDKWAHWPKQIHRLAGSLKPG